MGIGCRVFLIDDNDSLQRISMGRLTRLLHFDRRESLQQYAGKRVRCAMVFLEVAGRQVQAIMDIDYFLLQFNDISLYSSPTRPQAIMIQEHLITEGPTIGRL